MSESKHTPGPWKTIKPGHGHETEYLSVQIGEDEMYTTLEMLPADARLVSASPDLLAACKAVVEEDGFRGSALMRKRIAQMKAAIAKAEGTL